MNRRHMTGDHHGGTAGEQFCRPEPWTRFSARTSENQSGRLPRRAKVLEDNPICLISPYVPVASWIRNKLTLPPMKHRG